jgi:aspartyl-tRNA(Asn)/glutamyl-tRNA(Gln) amidotransferase subunit B
VRAGIQYEIERQIEVIEAGGRVIQESRLWNAAEGRTYSMRSKEQAHDYRYFPEPDLPPLVLTSEFIERKRAELPELPEARRARYAGDFDLSIEQAKDKALSDRFDAGISYARSSQGYTFDIKKFAKKYADILLNQEGSRLNAYGLAITASPITVSGNVAATIHSISGELSSKQTNQLYDISFSENMDFPDVYDREKPQQITDSSALEAMIDAVIKANPKQVEQYRAGKTTMAGFFVGQVMRASKGQANPALLNELVTKKLEG